MNLVALLLHSLLMMAGMSERVEILAPVPYSSIGYDESYLVGRTSAPLVEVYVNGERLYDARVVDSVFHVRIGYGYGLNEIMVRPIFRDEVDSARSRKLFELLCVPPGGEAPERLYPTYQFHASELGENCSSCHTLPGQMTDTLTSTACLDCHVGFADSAQTTVGRHQSCLTCHPKAELARKSRSHGDPSARRCFECHSDKIEKFDQEYIHGPVAGGSCTVCHDPHLSEYEHSLVEAEEILCFSCHDFSRESRDFPVQHPPFANGECSACHDPHATNNRWVLTRTSEEVCLPCHDSNGRSLTDHGHPYNVKPKKGAVPSVKLSRNGRLECISCHDPHASRSAHLLRTSQRNACLGCHGEKL